MTKIQTPIVGRFQQLILIAVLFVGFGLRTCYAQAIHDSGTWLSINTQGDIQIDCCNESRFKWWFDGHLRLFDDADGFGQSIVRPAVGYALSENVTIWAGYG